MKIKVNHLLLMLFAFSAHMSAFAGTKETAIAYLKNNLAVFKLNENDVKHILVDEHYDETSKIHYVYVQQTIDGIKIQNAIMTLAIKNDQVFHTACNLIPSIHERVKNDVVKISETHAIQSFAQSKGMVLEPQIQKIKSLNDTEQTSEFKPSGIAKETIKTYLVYIYKNKEIRLAWAVEFDELNGHNYYSAKIDAENGSIIQTDNYTVSCTFHNHAYKHIDKPAIPNEDGNNNNESLIVPNSYAVYPAPYESPNETTITTITNPADATYSPYGWHDTNGAAGNEFTVTKGNNVYVQDDKDANNSGGVSPDCGANIECVFPIDLTQGPDAYANAAMTNYFFWNNYLHDVLAYYGFTEAAGNFQQRNYTGAQGAGDYVRADWSDGLNAATPTLDNANFATLPDGQASRMQMFRFSAAQPNFFQVQSPASIANTYFCTYSNWTTTVLPNPAITSQVVQALDGTAPNTDICQNITNATNLVGKIAMIDRGTCEFGAKALKAQQAGAVAVIICNNVDGAAVNMGAGASGNSVTIPVTMLSMEDCQLIKTEMSAGNTVTVKLQYDPASPQKDGALDNGVVSHEYGHGLSNKLVGGRLNTSCLTNQFQPGEGWSDYLALWFSMKSNDAGTDRRGMGNYAFSEPTTATIRHKMYSTDMTLNNLTLDNLLDAFDNVASGSPTFKTGGQYYIGTLWCTIMWDLTWKLVQQYGFDPNQKTGTGGNNMAMKLVVQGMKLQPCTASFIDMRQSIFAADQALYGGANTCLIWEVFARRGLGELAETPDASDATNFTTDFTIPASCTSVLGTNDINHSSYGDLRYNNPFVNGDIISFTPEETQKITIAIFNTEGKEMESLFSGIMNAGQTYTLKLNKTYPKGIYYLNLNADKFKETRKIVTK